MEKLERLTQDESSRMFKLPNGNFLRTKDVIFQGKIRTLVVRNPCADISQVIDEMAERDSVFIPKEANSYVVSDFNPATQHIRRNDAGEEKNFSVYAVQFYRYFTV